MQCEFGSWLKRVFLNCEQRRFWGGKRKKKVEKAEKKKEKERKRKNKETRSKFGLVAFLP